MVPESVRNAWADLPESRKAAASRACAKKQPLIFKRWVDAAGLTNFRRDSLVNRKAGTGPRLDVALFTAEQGELAADFLVCYFTELSSEVNDQYLGMLEQTDDEQPETKLKIYAKLLKQHSDWPYLRLYLATALWVEGFAEQDMGSVEDLAKEVD